MDPKKDTARQDMGTGKKEPNDTSKAQGKDREGFDREKEDQKLAGPKGSTAAAYSTGTHASQGDIQDMSPNARTGNEGFKQETYPARKDIPGPGGPDVGAGRSAPDGPAGNRQNAMVDKDRGR